MIPSSDRYSFGSRRLSTRAVLLATAIGLAVLARPGSAQQVRMPRAMAVTPDGTAIWVALEDGLVRFAARDGSFTAFSTRNGLPPGGVNAVCVDSRGEPFVGTDNGAAWRESGRWRSCAAGLPSPVVLSVAVTRAGTFFAGTDRGIARYRPERADFRNILDSHEFCRQAVLAIGEEPGGSGVWFARERAVERLDQRSGEFEIYQKDYLNPDEACPLLGRWPTTLAVANDGAVWIPTENGISIVRRESDASRRWEEIPILSGPLGSTVLPSRDVRALALDRERAWIAFGDARIAQGGLGVALVEGGRAVRRSGRADGLPDGRVHALAVAPDRTLWAASPAGLASWAGSRWKAYGWPPP